MSFEKRAIDGIIVLDKPCGMTSNRVLQKVKRLIGAKKAGHTGSLDPLATGVLPICLGHATKISQFLLESQKTYLVTAELGTMTSTGDKEGEIIQVWDVPDFSQEHIEDVLKQFLGTQTQIPPMYSAIKHKGEPLYKLARQGKEVARKARTIEITALDLVAQEKQNDKTLLTMQVACSKGTYVRTLVEDIGKVLGCGAHVKELRRTALGPFTEQHMVTFDDLCTESDKGKDLVGHVLPIASALGHWPSIRLTEDSAFYVKQGQAVQARLTSEADWVQLIEPSGHLFGIGKILPDGRVTPKRLFLS